MNTSKPSKITSKFDPMFLRKDTQRLFSEKGISVRYYPEATYEEFQKRVYREEYDYAYNYNKDDQGMDEEKLVEKAKQFAYDRVYGKYARAVDSYNYNILYIEYDEKLIIKKIPKKSMEITQVFIQKLIDKNEKLYSGFYGNFALRMQKLIRKEINSAWIYPTTYGIGVWVFYNFGAKESIEKVENLLKKYGVEYHNEFSDAQWVYRFKISKRKSNLELLP